jgi:hypothetical protein
MVPCNCPKCNGNLVDVRTKMAHEVDQDSDNEQDSEVVQEGNNPLSSLEDNPVSFDEDSDNDRSEIQRMEMDETGYLLTDSLRRQRSREYINQQATITEQEIPLELFTTDEESSENSENETNSDDNNDHEHTEIFEDYSPPVYDQFQDQIGPNTTINPRFLWILLWIMSFRKRFNIPETATESLIQFIKLILTEIGGSDFEEFPGSLYLARNALGLKDQYHKFAACPKCHKLYNKKEVEEFQQDGDLTVMKCSHVEFPNSTSRRLKQCQTALTEQSTLLQNRIKLQAEKIFPFASIRKQLASMYSRPGFEQNLRHWSERKQFNDILTDIYDGQIWKNFKETNDENSPNFFRPEVADSHLGLMFNLDWFQPYDGVIHSTGVIYAAICNLPRDIRFKRENMLVLGLLPGPNEVSLHKINHYLAPIVDELVLLWDGVTLNKTFEHQETRTIRAALILVSCDIPAARKICGHISALSSCYRCEKKANYENHKHNFAGMDNMNEWFISRNSAQFRENALGWRRCNSNAARDRFVKITGVRWSELLRLTYFDPIRFLSIDPMHCLFLGIAKWIVKRIWVDENVLKSESLREIQKKMNQFQVPADVGRIPGKVECGEGFANFTADQWRIFFTIYATVSLWKHLPDVDRKILTRFVRICTILVGRIVQSNLMDEAHQKLVEVVKIIEQNYGRDMITPNLHLSLHLCECAKDFGPLYAFWCFSFERMNGVLGKVITSKNAFFFYSEINYFLGSLPNSHRKIEPELMRRIMNDNQINSIINSGIVDTKGLDILGTKPSVGSISETDEFTSDEMERYLLYSQNIKESPIVGCEAFPGKMLGPSLEKVLMSSEMLDIMVDYYNATYPTYNFRKPFGEGPEDSIVIPVKMSQFGRCRIGSETFGSKMSSRHVKSSFIVAKFITADNDVDVYPGQVQFYFIHTIDFPNGPVDHFLAYVRWYQHANSSSIRYYFSSNNDYNTCNVELWHTEFYQESRDCIIPVHHILSRFIPVNYRISDQRNAREYLAVNQINRKYHIR